MTAKERYQEAAGNLLKAIEIYQESHRDAVKEGIEEAKARGRQTLSEYLDANSPNQEFKPKMVYSDMGDVLWYYWKKDMPVSETHGPVTLEMKRKTNTPVGVKVYGILHMLKEHLSKEHNFKMLRI